MDMNGKAATSSPSGMPPATSASAAGAPPPNPPIPVPRIDNPTPEQNRLISQIDQTLRQARSYPIGSEPHSHLNQTAAQFMARLHESLCDTPSTSTNPPPQPALPAPPPMALASLVTPTAVRPHTDHLALALNGHTVPPFTNAETQAHINRAMRSALTEKEMAEVREYHSGRLPQAQVPFPAPQPGPSLQQLMAQPLPQTLPQSLPMPLPQAMPQAMAPQMPQANHVLPPDSPGILRPIAQQPIAQQPIPQPQPIVDPNFLNNQILLAILQQQQNMQQQQALLRQQQQQQPLQLAPPPLPANIANLGTLSPVQLMQLTNAIAGEQQRQAEAHARAQLEAQVRAQLEAQARAQAEAQAKAQAEARAKAAAEADARRRAEAHAHARAQAEANQNQLVQHRLNVLAAAQAQAQAQQAQARPQGPDMAALHQQLLAQQAAAEREAAERAEMPDLPPEELRRHVALVNEIRQMWPDLVDRDVHAAARLLRQTNKTTQQWQNEAKILCQRVPALATPLMTAATQCVNEMARQAAQVAPAPAPALAPAPPPAPPAGGGGPLQALMAEPRNQQQQQQQQELTALLQQALNPQPAAANPNHPGHLLEVLRAQQMQELMARTGNHVAQNQARDGRPNPPAPLMPIPTSEALAAAQRNAQARLAQQPAMDHNHALIQALIQQQQDVQAEQAREAEKAQKESISANLLANLRAQQEAERISRMTEQRTANPAHLMQPNASPRPSSSSQQASSSAVRSPRPEMNVNPQWMPGPSMGRGSITTGVVPPLTSEQQMLNLPFTSIAQLQARVKLTSSIVGSIPAPTTANVNNEQAEIQILPSSSRPENQAEQLARVAEMNDVQKAQFESETRAAKEEEARRSAEARKIQLAAETALNLERAQQMFMPQPLAPSVELLSVLPSGQMLQGVMVPGLPHFPGGPLHSIALASFLGPVTDASLPSAEMMQSMPSLFPASAHLNHMTHPEIVRIAERLVQSTGLASSNAETADPAERQLHLEHLKTLAAMAINSRNTPYARGPTPHLHKHREFLVRVHNAAPPQNMEEAESLGLLEAISKLRKLSDYASRLFLKSTAKMIIATDPTEWPESPPEDVSYAAVRELACTLEYKKKLRDFRAVAEFITNTIFRTSHAQFLLDFRRIYPSIQHLDRVLVTAFDTVMDEWLQARIRMFGHLADAFLKAPIKDLPDHVCRSLMAEVDTLCRLQPPQWNEPSMAIGQFNPPPSPTAVPFWGIWKCFEKSSTPNFLTLRSPTDLKTYKPGAVIGLLDVELTKFSKSNTNLAIYSRLAITESGLVDCPDIPEDASETPSSSSNPPKSRSASGGSNRSNGEATSPAKKRPHPDCEGDGNKRPKTEDPPPHWRNQHKAQVTKILRHISAVERLSLLSNERNEQRNKIIAEYASMRNIQMAKAAAHDLLAANGTKLNARQKIELDELADELAEVNEFIVDTIEDLVSFNHATAELQVKNFTGNEQQRENEYNRITALMMEVNARSMKQHEKMTNMFSEFTGREKSDAKETDEDPFLASEKGDLFKDVKRIPQVVDTSHTLNYFNSKTFRNLHPKRRQSILLDITLRMRLDDRMSKLSHAQQMDLAVAQLFIKGCKSNGDQITDSSGAQCTVDTIIQLIGHGMPNVEKMHENIERMIKAVERDSDIQRRMAAILVEINDGNIQDRLLEVNHALDQLSDQKPEEPTAVQEPRDPSSNGVSHQGDPQPASSTSSLSSSNSSITLGTKPVKRK